jgi:metallophosphoesterase superfamily enzyme
MKIALNGSELTLLPEKALYKEDERLLVIADVHLGKASHFRKEGISISSGIQAEDFLNLERLFHKLKPAKVYFLGDLFHSSYNHDWRHFCDLVAFVS